jgi:hypothetical protein
MPLVDVELAVGGTDIPREVRAFLGEAERRIERFQMTSRSPAFVPSDYAGAYGVLHALLAANLAPGERFCEWGSGFGVVTGLAALLGFDACGIEIDADLVDAARQLADDFDLPVQFARDSFIPAGAAADLDAGGAYAWLATDAGGAEEELGLAADDFDVIFAYPWPDEEEATARLFRRHAAVGAVLVTYHGGEGFRLRRKVGLRHRRGRPRSRPSRP